MKTRYLVPLAVILLWFGWLAAIVGIAERATLLKNLQNLGSFGDSFGVIASLMASLAAAGAFITYSAQKETDALQQFDQQFYSLLENFQAAVQQIDVTRRKRSKEKRLPEELRYVYGEIENRSEGKEAIRLLAIMLRLKIKKDDFRDTKIVASIYAEFYNKWYDDLGHYFRLLYHIFRLIDERCPGDKKYYAQLVRAHLSNSEQCLLAYNCICGEGRHKFVIYVERYSILHNLHRIYADGDKCLDELLFFQRKLPAGSFRFEETKAVTY